MVSDYEHEVDDAFEHIEDGMHWITHGQQLEGEEHAVLLTLLALVDQLILLPRHMQQGGNDGHSGSTLKRACVFLWGMRQHPVRDVNAHGRQRVPTGRR